ncbi:hypothetical protein [Klebsiella pneumoniae]|uniref:hypothetical protein n=1 Tax=Klebsiella pneumoniae TaxID=573 RepID=UPI0024BE8496|nr:hypothetical protein [Klebsiella pneumoniae]
MSLRYGLKNQQSGLMLIYAEIEDMPDKVYSVNARGTDINEKAMTQKAVRESYAKHVHGCLLRLAAIVFQTLPFERMRHFRLHSAVQLNALDILKMSTLSPGGYAALKSS